MKCAFCTAKVKFEVVENEAYRHVGAADSNVKPQRCVSVCQCNSIGYIVCDVSDLAGNFISGNGELSEQNRQSGDFLCLR